MSSSAVLHGSCTRPSSSSDLQLEIYRAAAKNDRKALADAVQDYIERYGSDTGPDDPLQKLQGFLPLLPALSDPKSPKYTEALEYFSGSDRWSILRWMWVRRFELPQEDAITFLGGRENEPFLGFLVQLLLNDQEAMEKMVRAYFGNPRNLEVGRSFVIRYLYAQHAQKKPTIPDQNMRPAQAKTLRQEIAEWLR